MKHLDRLLAGAELEAKDMEKRRDEAVANHRYSEAECFEIRRQGHLGYCSIFRYLQREGKAASVTGDKADG